MSCIWPNFTCLVLFVVLSSDWRQKWGTYSQNECGAVDGGAGGQRERPFTLQFRVWDARWHQKLFLPARPWSCMVLRLVNLRAGRKCTESGESDLKEPSVSCMFVIYTPQLNGTNGMTWETTYYYYVIKTLHFHCSPLITVIQIMI